ncbi:MAG: preprotein translocase subunit Sec61beta [Methanobrevibacter sp. CfCl-M3]
MAKKDKISLPQSGAGLVRYFDDEDSGPKVSPEQIVIVTIVLAAVCIILRFSTSS